MNPRGVAARQARSRRALVSRVIERQVVASLSDAEREAALARQRAVLSLCERGPTEAERQQAMAVLASSPQASQGSLKLG